MTPSKKRQSIRRIMRVIFSFVLIASMLISCAKSENNDNATNQVDEFRSYSIDMEMPSTRLADMIDTVILMRFEETENSFLRYVLTLSKFDQGFVVPTKGGLTVFDERGNFSHNIHKMGIGPEEHGRIYDFWIEGDTISVFSKEDQYIKRYSMAGDFISSFRLPYFTQHVFPLENGFVYDLNYELFKDSIKSRLLLLNEKHELKDSFLPYTTIPKMHVFSQFPSIKPYGDGATYLGVMSDSLYHIKNHQVKPLMHFNFGEKWYWDEEGKMMLASPLSERSKSKVSDINTFLNREYVLLTARMRLSEPSPFLIDRRSGEITLIDLSNKGDGRNSISFIAWDAGYLMASIHSNDIDELLEEVVPSRVKFKSGTTLEEIETSENPVLMWLKFKQ